MSSFIKKVLVTILTLESRLILKKYRPFIVAVTGSVGKTTTKDAIYAVIKGQCRHARKSEKSLNSEIGLPLTILGVPNAWRDLGGWFRNIVSGLELIMWNVEYPDCLILEIGADHPGDISRVAKWLRPDIAVITRVSQTPVHVEFFPTPEDVFKEKSSLAKSVKKGGALVLFADEEKVASLAGQAKEAGVTVYTFGMSPQAQVRGSEYAPVYAEQDNGKTLVGMSFKLDIEGNSIPITINGVLGAPCVYPMLAAAAVGRARGVPINALIEGFTGFHAPRGRMNVLAGINSSTIIDDSYNSSPDAVEVALGALKEVSCSGRKIAVLGDMMELGKYASDEHKKVGKLVAESANNFVTVGQRMRTGAVEEALKNGMTSDAVHSFDSSEEAAAYVVSIVKFGDLVLVKGSQSMRMEKVSKALLGEPMRAGELLVRQEKEWLEKA